MSQARQGLFSTYLELVTSQAKRRIGGECRRVNTCMWLASVQPSRVQEMGASSAPKPRYSDLHACWRVARALARKTRRGRDPKQLQRHLHGAAGCASVREQTRPKGPCTAKMRVRISGYLLPVVYWRALQCYRCALQCLSPANHRDCIEKYVGHTLCLESCDYV